MKQVPTKTTGDTLSADEYSLCTSQECQNQVENTDQTLSDSNLNQLTQSTNRIANNALTFNDVTGGPSNNYILSEFTQFSNITLTSLFQGMAIIFEAIEANSGAVTLNVNALGAIPLINIDGSPLEANQLVPGVVNYVKFVGTNFILAPFNATDLAFQIALASQSSGSEGSLLVGNTDESVKASLSRILNAYARTTNDVNTIVTFLADFNVANITRIGVGIYDIVFDSLVTPPYLVIANAFTGVERAVPVEGTLGSTGFTMHTLESSSGTGVKADAKFSFTVFK